MRTRTTARLLRLPRTLSFTALGIAVAGTLACGTEASSPVAIDGAVDAAANAVADGGEDTPAIADAVADFGGTSDVASVSDSPTDSPLTADGTIDATADDSSTDDGTADVTTGPEDDGPGDEIPNYGFEYYCVQPLPEGAPCPTQMLVSDPAECGDGGCYADPIPIMA
jgi:hypothetical protein